jgi:hypothetical protein
MSGAYPIDCGVVKSWRGLARQGGNSAFVPSAIDCPSSITIVLAINDRVTHDLLKTVSQVVAINTSGLSVGVRNQSTCDWHIGVIGKAASGQILFQTEDGAENEFSVMHICGGVSYGSFVSSGCREISVSISEESRDMGKEEEITGRIEFRDSREAWGRCEYRIALKASQEQ